MLPDNLPKVLMKDMGLIFPATLASSLFLPHCPFLEKHVYELMSFLFEYVFPWLCRHFVRVCD